MSLFYRIRIIRHSELERYASPSEAVQDQGITDRLESALAWCARKKLEREQAQQVARKRHRTPTPPLRGTTPSCTTRLRRAHQKYVGASQHRPRLARDRMSACAEWHGLCHARHLALSGLRGGTPTPTASPHQPELVTLLEAPRRARPRPRYPTTGVRMIVRADTHLAVVISQKQPL